MLVPTMHGNERRQRANRRTPGGRAGRPLIPLVAFRSCPTGGCTPPYGQFTVAARPRGRLLKGALPPLSLRVGWTPPLRKIHPAGVFAGARPPRFGAALRLSASHPSSTWSCCRMTARDARLDSASPPLTSTARTTLRSKPGGSSASEAGLRRRQGKPSCPPWGASGDLPCAGAPVISPWVASQPAWGPVCCARSSGPWGQPHRNRLSHPWGGAFVSPRLGARRSAPPRQGRSAFTRAACAGPVNLATRLCVR